MDIEELGKVVIGSAIEVHKTLGPGLLESCYERCLVHELKSQNVNVEAQKTLSIKYKGEIVHDAFRLDLFVEDKIIVEVKSVDEVKNLHMAQILTYLKLSNIKLGYLINFNVPLLKNGIKRVVNQ